MIFRFLFILFFAVYVNLFALSSKEQNKVVDELSVIVSSYLYNLEYENIPLIVEALAVKNKNIKAIEIREDFENKIVYSYCVDNEKAIYNRSVPKSIKENYFNITKKSKFNEMIVGEVTIYFTKIVDLKLDTKEKEYLEQNSFNIYATNWEPFTIFDKKTNSYDGLAIEFWNIVSQKINIDFNIYPIDTFSEMLEKIKNDEYGVLLSTSYTKKRGEYALFSKPYVSFPIAISTGSKESFLVDLNQLNGKRVAVGKNYSAHKLLKKHYPKIQFVPVNNTYEAVKLLSKKQVFAAADILPVLKHNLEKFNSSDIKISGTSEFKFEVRFMVNKKQEELIPILNKAIDAIDENERKLINAKWINKQIVVEKFNYTLLYYFLLITVVIVVFLLYRQYILNKLNIKLNDKVEERTKDLKKLNETLEIKVAEQVEKLRQNDILIAEQSKMAAMGEMIANISHQWRQPLSVISTGVTGLKLQKECNTLSDEQFFKVCDAVNENAQYLSRTIDDFRNFIRGDREKVKFALIDNINSFLHLVEGSIKNNSIEIQKNIPNDIYLESYPQELIQCFINIFNNSKDALKNIESPRLIFISAHNEKDKITITLKDNGGGIPEDILHRIFEPYFTTKHKSQGTGLGLHMTYNLIVDGLNGTIEADNVTYSHKAMEYKGTEIKIVLPCS